MKSIGHGQEVFRRELKGGLFNRVAVTGFNYSVWIGCDPKHNGETEYGHLTRHFELKSKALQYARSTKPQTFHDKYVRDVLYNYGASLGAAIRNSIDPQDPSKDTFRAVIGPRFTECVDYMFKNGIDAREGMELIGRGIANQVEFLTSGFITELRANVVENCKKRGIK